MTSAAAAPGEIVLKCVVVGDGAVGKTSLLYVYAKNEYTEKYIPTVFDNYSANVIVDGRQITLGLWDTAGQEDYDRLRPLSYPGTNVFLLCFAVSSRTSFQNVKLKWIEEIKHHEPRAAVLLIGTKIDLRSDPMYRKTMELNGETFVDYKDGVELAQKIGAVKYIECSAKTRERLKSVFDEAIRAAMFGNRNTKKQAPMCTLL